MYKAKRVMGGFAVVGDETGKVLEKFNGKGAKARAETRADLANDAAKEKRMSKMRKQSEANKAQPRRRAHGRLI
jgi:hypothetical protein